MLKVTMTGFTSQRCFAEQQYALCRFHSRDANRAGLRSLSLQPCRYGTQELPILFASYQFFVCGGIGRQRQSFGQRIGRIEQEGLRRRLPSQSAQQFTVLIRILGPGILQTFLAESVGFYL